MSEIVVNSYVTLVIGQKVQIMEFVRMMVGIVLKLILCVFQV